MKMERVKINVWLMVYYIIKKLDVKGLVEVFFMEWENT